MTNERFRIGWIGWWVCGLATVTLAASDRLDLAGTWRFALDPNDVGQAEQWFERDLPEALQLPGSLQEQGFGRRPSRQTPWTTRIGNALLDDPRFAEAVQDDDFRCPFWLTPRRHYVGAAWYQRSVTIPETWQDRRVVLTLERPHWQTTVWVDRRCLGSQDGLGVAHAYDLTEAVGPGRTIRLTLRVDNRLVVPVGPDAHSVSDQTQSNWNGIAGRIELTATPRVFFDDVQIFPDVAGRRITVDVRLGNAGGGPGSGTLRCHATSAAAASRPQTVPVTWDASGGHVRWVHELGEAAVLWDEFSPNLMQLYLQLGDQLERFPFGLREVTIDQTQFAVNGRRIFLRGTLECCVFPQHGYPPTDVAAWRRILATAKRYGLNHIRFHSWCPPEAAFVAADELGLYLQVEGSCWAHFGDGTALDAWIGREIDRMIRQYGNHPSWVFLCPSNEPGGRNRDAFLGELLDTYQRRDPRRFYVAGAGWPQIPQNQYAIDHAVRLQRWDGLRFDQPPRTDLDYRAAVERTGKPLIGHEIGQWCAYPDLDEVGLYTGVLRARNLEVFRDKLERAGLGDWARPFLRASGGLQRLLCKQEIEAALRTPGFAGFQMLGLTDFPGQGTAPVGLLNALWQSKGLITPDEMRRFCSETVILARMDRRVWTADQTLTVDVDVAHYGPHDLGDATVVWQLRRRSGGPVADGSWSVGAVPTGGLTRLGRLERALDDVQVPAQLTLSVRWVGTDVANDWDLWVYPNEPVPPAKDVVVTSTAAEALAALKRAARVLWVVPPAQVAGDTVGSFRPIFWNRITFPRSRVHTLGILCDPDHPAFAAFPTDMHSSWQWQELLDGAPPLVLDALPPEMPVLIRAIDDWNDCRRLAVMFEATVGPGRLLMTPCDLSSRLDERPAARQLRRSLLAYMESAAFAPATVLSERDLLGLIRPDEAAK